jgi:NAD(P)H-nitrite reductase large subunit
VAEPLVIVGAGPAAVAAVEAIRRAGEGSPIVLVGAEGEPAYCRCLLAQVLAGKIGRADLDWRPESFYRQMGVECLWGQPAVGIDPEARVVELEGGRRLRYKALLLATCAPTPTRGPLGRPAVAPEGRSWSAEAW